MLYITSPGLIYLMTENLYLLSPFSSLSTSTSGKHKSVLSMSLALVFIFYILNINESIRYLFFSSDLFHWVFML